MGYIVTQQISKDTKNVKLSPAMDTTHIAAAQITLNDLVDIPKIMKNSIMLNSNTDPLL